MKLKEIPRTATFAWSPDPVNPTIVTGTAAGTIDADFSAATELELWKLDLLDHSIAAFTAAPVARVETDSRFHDVAVSGDGNFVVGALENGVVEAWKVPDLKSVARNDSAHTSAVKSVAFSPKEQTKFATGGSQGQVFIWNVQDLSSPFTPGTAAAQRHDDVESVCWNSTAVHILASGGNKGFASIWDTRRKREVLHLHYNSPTSGSRVPISSVQWHPTNSTKLATASMDDNEPVICIWDLKNVNSPERVLRGHSKGVLSLDWCQHDENLLLSGGRDNATMLWNPEAGEQLGTYPISVEWAFKTQFNPHMPDLFASASFDGKISVQTLQDTTSAGADFTSRTPAKATNGADFWESDTVMDAVHPSFKLQQPPKWLVRPISATFGFGGKLVIADKGKVDVKSVTDSVLDKEFTKNFSEALQSENFTGIKELASSRSEVAKSGWDLLTSLVKGEDLALPEEPIRKDGDKNGAADADEDEDEFNIVPPYAPSSDFELLSSKHPSVVAAVLAKDFDSAVSQLIAHGEAGDALLIASFGSPDLVKRAQNAYLNSQAEKESYLRTAWAVATKNISDIVERSELKAWPSVLRAVLSGGDSTVTKDATYKLGKRLVDSGDRKNALLVYLSGHNVGAAASLWLDELPQIEKQIVSDEKTTSYVAHVRALQIIVEKLVVATAKLGLPSISDPGADRLYSAFRDYADVASQQGDLLLAKLFLDMLPEEYAADKQRVNVATEPKQAPQARQRAIPGAHAAGQSPLRHNPAVPSPAPVNIPAPTVLAPAPASPARTSSANVPTARRATQTRATGSAHPATLNSAYPANPYAPQGISPAAASVAASAAAAAKATTAPAAVASGTVPPPPAVGNNAASSAGSSRSSPAPFKGWNDIPELPNNARRTPAAPTRVAPTRVPATAAPPSTSPRTSVSAAAPPPPPPTAGAGAVGSAAVGAAPPHHMDAQRVQPPPQQFGGAVPPPAATSRPSNPYAPSPSSRPSSRAASASTKPNPYAPPPGSATQPPVSTNPVPTRPGSRAAAPPPRARAAAPPPATSHVAPPPAVQPPASSQPSVKTPPVSTPPPPTSSSRPGKNSTTANGLAEPLKPILSNFSGELQRVRPVIEAQYAKQYTDTARRLQILYDQLATLSEPVTSELLVIAEAVTSRDYTSANSAVQRIASDHADETGEWFTGVRRLVKMSSGVPV